MFANMKKAKFSMHLEDQHPSPTQRHLHKSACGEFWREYTVWLAVQSYLIQRAIQGRVGLVSVRFTFVSRPFMLLIIGWLRHRQIYVAVQSAQLCERLTRIPFTWAEIREIFGEYF